MFKYLLSICIPVYNRAAYLDQLLKSIFESQNINKSEIEVCISDNNSSDETIEVITKWMAQTTIPIILHKNPENIGAERNFIKALSLSSGRYVTLAGSDDLYSPTTLSSAFYYMRREYDFIFFDIKTFHLNHNITDDSFSFNLNDDREFFTKNEILRFFGTELNFITSLFIKREFYITERCDDEKIISDLHQYGFSYVFRFLSLIPTNLKSVLISKDHVLHRCGKYDVWYDHHKYFFIGMGKLLCILPSYGYDVQAVKIAKSKNLKKYINPDSMSFARLVQGKQYYKDVLYYYLYFPYIIIPKFLSKNSFIRSGMKALIKRL